MSTGDQPHVDVEDEIREACQRWRVKAIVVDRFRWARSLQLLADDGLPVEEFSQSPARLTPATQRVAEAVLNAATNIAEPRPRVAGRQRGLVTLTPGHPHREGPQRLETPDRSRRRRRHGVRCRCGADAYVADLGLRP